MSRIKRVGGFTASVLAMVALAYGLFLSAIVSDAAAQDDASTPAASPAADAAYTLTIDATQSFARYVAQEELQGTGDNEVVGETQAIQGTILFDESWLPIAGSRIDVDMRTLVSDEARRDNYLYDNVLETGEFPLATFIVTGIEGLDAGLVNGEEATFTLVGDLTLHGVTNEAKWEVTATLDGETLTGSATTSFELQNFEMEKPIVGPVISIDDIIVLEMDVVAVPTA
jgi:polyisoprenoid-binding protein YceI